MVAVILGILTAAVGAAEKDVWTVDARSLHVEDRVLAASAQGIANRSGPRVFLNILPTDAQWREWYSERFGFNFRELDSVEALIGRLRDEFTGYILFDPRDTDVINIAMTLSGQQDAVIATPQQAAELQGMGLECVADLTERFDGWSRVRIYQWLYRNLLSHSAHDCIANNYGQFGGVRVDLSEYAGDGGDLFVRFEDATKGDGMGAKLRRLSLETPAGAIASFAVNTDAEQRYLVDADRSWFDPQGDRIADFNQYYTYRFEIPPGAEKLTLTATVRNQYEIRVGPSQDGPFETVARAIDQSTFNPHFADYCIYRGAASICLSSDPSQEDEYDLKDRFYGELEPWAQVFSWTGDEGRSVTQTSKNALLTICCGSTDFSFHAAVETDYEFDQPPAQERAELDPNKVYLTYILSDGDAYHWVFSFHDRQWFLSERGSVPFGWELQPLLLDMAPAAAQHFYETGTANDYQVASASGVGYVHPEDLPEGKLEEYLRLSRPYLEKLDMRAMTVLSATNVGEDVVGEYGEVLGDLVAGCQEGYALRRTPGWFFDNGLSWARSLLFSGRGNSNEQVVEQIVNVAKENPQRPLFIPFHLFCYEQDIADAKWWTDHLPENFEVLRPDEFYRLLGEALRGTVAFADAPGSMLLPETEGAEIGVPVRNNDAQEREVRVSLFDNDDRQRARGQLTAEPWSTTIARLAIGAVTTDDSGAWSLRLEAGDDHETKQLSVRVARLPAGIRLKQIQPVFERGGEDMSGRMGTIADDPAAMNGLAKRVTPEQVIEPQHCIFGPYQPFEAGQYVAVFLIRAAEGVEGEAFAALVDVAGAPGGRTAHASREVTVGEIAGSQYRPIVLPFQLEEKEKKLETRVFTRGEVELWIDHVGVFEAEAR